MSGGITNIAPSFVARDLGSGEAVPPATLMSFQTLADVFAFGPPPDKLVVYDPRIGSHVGTGVREVDLERLRAFRSEDGSAVPDSLQANAKKILLSVGIRPETLSDDRQRVQAAALLGTGEVSAGWMTTHIEAIRDGDQEAVNVGRRLMAAYGQARPFDQSRLGDPYIARNAYVALAVAKDVVRDDGSLDLKALRAWRAALTSSNASPEMPQGPHREHIAMLLQRLDHDAALRGVLGSIDVPNGRGNPADGLIRATLMLDGKQELSKADAQRAALSAALAELRQGQVGSCFATSICILIHDEKPKTFLNSMKELIATGTLTGNVPGVGRSAQPIEMPINQSIHGDFIREKLDISWSGEVYGWMITLPDRQMPLHSVPGVSQALEALGIHGPAQQRKALDASLKALSTNSGSNNARGVFGSIYDKLRSPHHVQCSIKTIIDGLADDPIVQKQSSRDAVRTLAGDAFHAAHENRLLRAWEYTVSGFAEATQGSKCWSNLNNSMYHYLYTSYRSALSAIEKRAAESQGGTGSTNKQEDKVAPRHIYEEIVKSESQTFIGALLSAFNEGLRISYDADLRSSRPSNDGVSTAGGFEIKFSKTNAPAVRVASLMDLQTILYETGAMSLTQLVKNLQDKYPESEYRALMIEEITSVAQSVLREIGQDDFMETLGQIDNLQTDPFSFKQGAQPDDIIALCFGGPRKLTRAELPKAGRQRGDAGDVLLFLSEQLHAMNVSEATGAKGGRNHNNSVSSQALAFEKIESIVQDTDLKKPSYGAFQSDGIRTKDSVIAHNAVHAFLVKPTLDRRFSMLWQALPSELPTMIEVTINPEKLKAFARTPISADNLHRIMPSLCSKLSLSRNLVEAELKGKQITPGNLAATLVGLLPATNREALARGIEAELAKALKVPWEPIIIADSNWGGGRSHVYFGVVQSPFTGKQELWTFTRSEGNYEIYGKLSQKAHVEGGWWLCTNPDEYKASED